MSKSFLDLVEVMQELHASGMSIEELANTSGLNEKDVKSVVRKGEKLIRAKRDDAIRKLKPIYLKHQQKGDSYTISLAS